MIALVVPERTALTFEVVEIRLRLIEVDPVFPLVSVATTVIVLLPAVSPERTFAQVPEFTFANDPLTVTVAIHPVSLTVQEIVGVQVTSSPFICDVIITTGSTVSTILYV